MEQLSDQERRKETTVLVRTKVTVEGSSAHLQVAPGLAAKKEKVTWSQVGRRFLLTSPFIEPLFHPIRARRLVYKLAFCHHQALPARGRMNSIVRRLQPKRRIMKE